MYINDMKTMQKMSWLTSLEEKSKEHTSNIDSFTGVPIWNSFVVVSLVSNDVQKGILLLSVPINEKEFDFRMFNLVNSLSGIIASML